MAFYLLGLVSAGCCYQVGRLLCELDFYVVALLATEHSPGAVKTLVHVELGRFLGSHSDYRLKKDSRFRNRGTDGKDLGSDIDTIQKAANDLLKGWRKVAPN